jgi:hypothetical protein
VYLVPEEKNMKKVACTVLIFILIILLINPLSSEARGGFRGGWWLPWVIFGGAVVLSPYYGRHDYPPYDPYYSRSPVVVVPPDYTQRGPMPSSPPSSMERHFIYPRLGQDEKKQAEDDYQCHVWAVTQTGYDPTSGGPEIPQSPNLLDDYLRAKSACLDGRGYTMK